MTAPLTASAFERIDEACDRFEAAWKSGSEPRVEDYLNATAGPERDELHLELLRVDAHYRRRGSAVASQHWPSVAGYEVLGELGRGGMGVVYKARQNRPNRLVALKMISAGIHASPREHERFLHEAEAVAHLQHPNIVQVYQVGERDGHPYFALEYVAGGSLDRYLAGTPQPPQAAAQLVEHLAHAIHHAHERGIIHRDLKPANVLLQMDQAKESLNDSERIKSAICNLQSAIPKVTDFGLAKLLDLGAGSPTVSGDVLGTPSYMAPEQTGAAGQIGPATDVYGLGAILYELLTGRPPFRGETALETLLQVQTVEPVSPSRLQPKCPRDLVTICLKCLSKQPAQRYASAAELAEDLRRFLDGVPIRARPVGPLRMMLKWTRRQPKVATLAALLFLAVILGVGTGSWLWWQAEDGLAKTETALKNERTAQKERVATLDRFAVALAHREWLANNAKRVNTLLDDCTPEQRDSWEWRYLDRMRRSSLHTLAGHTNTVKALAVHPLGRKIASASHDTSVRLWDLDTGQSTVLGEFQSHALAVAWSRDGRLLAAGSRQGLLKLWDMDTGAVREFPFGGTGETPIWGLAFDRESRFLAMGGPRRLKVWDTREEKLVYDRVADNGDISQVAFSPDGSRLATVSKRVKVWDWAGNKIFDWPGHETGAYDLAFSPDGNLLASAGHDGLIRVHNLKTEKEEFVLSGHALSVTSVCFSPDGERLASAGQDGDMNVWSVKQRRRLFTLHGHSGAVWDLAFTAQGDRLVSAGSDRLLRVWVAAGGQEATLLPINTPNEVNALAYGPGGRLLAWGDDAGRTGIVDTSLNKEIFRHFAPAPKGKNPITEITFCPGGQHVAWRRSSGATTLRHVDKNEEIPLVGVDKGRVRALAFSADGKQLLAAQVAPGELTLRDLRTGQLLQTLPPPTGKFSQAVLSPLGKRLVVVEDRTYARVWDTHTGQLHFELEHQPAVTCVTFSEDGRFLALGGTYGKMSVWDLTEKRETMSVTGHSSNLYGLALSPDGRRLASTASDCTAKLWDTQTRHEVLTLRTQLHEHSPLAFSPDGADLAAVTIDNQLQVWSARNARRPP